MYVMHVYMCICIYAYVTECSCSESYISLNYVGQFSAAERRGSAFYLGVPGLKSRPGDRIS
jgi:hypothetical protein